MAFLVCCVLFLYSFQKFIQSIVHFTSHLIPFDCMTISYPKKKIFSSFYFCSAKEQAKDKIKIIIIIKEAMHAFYFILCAERTSDQDENSVFFFFLLSNQHFFVRLSFFFTLSLPSMRCMNSRNEEVKQ